MRRSYPKYPGKISSAPLSQPDPSVPHTDSCGGWGSSPSAPAPKCTSHLPYPACQNQNTRTLCAREEKPTQAALMPSATDRQKREAEQEQMENREFFKTKRNAIISPTVLSAFSALSWRLSEAFAGFKLFYHGCAQATPHFFSPTCPLSWTWALCSTDAELGRAKNTNTFFSLILHPVPTLQFKSQGAKQKTHTTCKHLFLSYPIFLPPQHMGHPEDDSDPIHLMGHMSCQQKTEAVRDKVSYLFFSSVASGRSPKHFSSSSDFKNMVYKEKCEISFLLPEYYSLDLDRGIGVDRFTSWLKMQNWVTHTQMLQGHEICLT